MRKGLFLRDWPLRHLISQNVMRGLALKSSQRAERNKESSKYSFITVNFLFKSFILTSMFQKHRNAAAFWII